VLGDNARANQSLIKIMSGLHQADSGLMKVTAWKRGSIHPGTRSVPGIATVYQDLAVVDLMETWRNFFLGSEMRKAIRCCGPSNIEACERSRRRAGKARHPPRTASISHLARCPRRAAERRDRHARSTSCQGSDPGRATAGTRRQAIRDRAQICRQGPRVRRGRRVSSPTTRITRS